MSKIDYSLYLVTDRGLSCGRSLEEIIEASVAGGATIVQLREKDASTREFYRLAKRAKNFLHPRHIPLIINDRIDIALAVKADGLHIGQSDMPYPVARKLMGTQAIIGLSVESVQDAIDADGWDVDYLGISPVFSTPTKTDIHHQLGLQGIRDIRAISRHTLVAIGGIHAHNTAEIIAAGADSIAVVSDLCSAPDPCEAAQKLWREIRRGRGELK
ncbi:MAG: thiamine phosphate synthase [Candidatus Cloacimonetes bacterium]|nr:thiamine phosphate synthase [Candidatus Cloacimonadota bacterium]